MPRAVIIGATSGIGYALAFELARRGYALGLAGRRTEILEEMQRALPGSVIRRIDVADTATAEAELGALVDALGGLDLLVISSGIGRPNPELEYAKEAEIIAVNVSGFTAMADAGFRYFRRQGHGRLVGLSSIAGIRGSRYAPAYGASKAFEINYLEALHNYARFLKLRDITVTTILPGFVDTPMTRGQQGMFWVAPAEKAARQIVDAIERKARVAYITRRWGVGGVDLPASAGGGCWKKHKILISSAPSPPVPSPNGRGGCLFPVTGTVLPLAQDWERGSGGEGTAEDE